MDTEFFCEVSAETDPTVPSYVKGITESNISKWNSYANVQSDWNVSNSSSSAYIKNKPTIPSISGLASTQYVDNKVATVVNSAPETLDTLNELAAALGNDPNFATTISTQIGEKVSKTELSNQSYITQTILNNAGYISSFTETDPTVPSYVKGITEANISSWTNKVSNVQADWNTSSSNDQSYIKNKPSIPSAVTESTVSGWGFTKNIGTLTSESDPTVPSYVKGILQQDITNWNNKANLPSYSLSDSGKLLSVNSSGQLVWIVPATIYTGSDDPLSGLGNNGDIYLQS